MKAHYEKVSTPQDASWRFYHRQLEALPFEWHFHPEYELTLTLNSAGKRYVGDHVGEYSSGDLVLMGPNLPHSWQSQWRPDNTQPHTAFVLWFSQGWAERLMSDFPEYRELRRLLAESARGVAFDPGVADNLLPAFQDLVTAAPRQRLRLLLTVFDGLLGQNRQTLASPRFDAVGLNQTDQHQLNRILDEVHRNFPQDMDASGLAAEMHMSQSTFNRFFRRHMKQSFHRYLTQVRLGHACSELIGSERPVSLIAEQSGFRNLANFNRLFRKYKGQTPRDFRRSFGAG